MKQLDPLIPRAQTVAIAIIPRFSPENAREFQICKTFNFPIMPQKPGMHYQMKLNPNQIITVLNSP